MNNIILIGFMASGKTSVSKELADILSKRVIDTDEEIEKNLKMSINDIFSEYGEEYFRLKETEVLKDVLGGDGEIISTGGGIVLKEENRALMKSGGIVVSLIPDFSVIESRLSEARSTRPLLKEQTDKIKKRYSDRLALYRECDVEINPDLNDSPRDTALEIIERIKSYAPHLYG